MSLFDHDVGSWEDLARSDPLWAVLSSDEFHQHRLTPEAQERFWASGEEHAAHVLAILAHELGFGGEPAVSIDFGCGVGRVLVPLARRSGFVLGLDASETMVQRAEARLAELSVDNATALVVGRQLDRAALERFGPVDLVHSALVFQHIVPAVGFGLFDQLLEVLAPGGFGFAQFHCHSPGGELARLIRSWRLSSPRFNALALKSRVHALSDVVMLYEYDMVELLRHLATHRIADVVMERIETGGDGYDIRLYFAKFEGTEEEFDAGGRAMKVRSRP